MGTARRKVVCEKHVSNYAKTKITKLTRKIPIFAIFFNMESRINI